MSTAAMNDLQFLVNTGAIIPDSPDSATKPEATAAMASPPQPQRPRVARPLQERDPELPDYTDDFTVTGNSGQLRMTDFFHTAIQSLKYFREYSGWSSLQITREIFREIYHPNPLRNSLGPVQKHPGLILALCEEESPGAELPRSPVFCHAAKSSAGAGGSRDCRIKRRKRKH